MLEHLSPHVGSATTKSVLDLDCRETDIGEVHELSGSGALSPIDHEPSVRDRYPGQKDAPRAPRTCGPFGYLSAT